jgi:cytochrome b6-f complex iron-sulfur subunit
MNSSISISSDDKCSRRNFLGKTLNGAKNIALGTFTVALINACSSDDGDSNPASPSNEDTNLTVDISASSNLALQNVGGIIALGANSIDDKGLFLVRRTESEVDVFSRECTHQSCVVSPFNGEVATCDCHGSQFSTTGKVLNGPANSPLRSYSASLDGNIITITP